MHSRLTILFAITLCLSVARADPIDLGTRRELFVDDYLVDTNTFSNTALTIHSPTNRGKVFEAEPESERRYTCGYTSLFRDGDLYRYYYRQWPDVNTPFLVWCCAESTNGIDWVRPNYGLYAYKGSTSNNVVMADPSNLGAFAPFIDSRPGVLATERYKAIGLAIGGAIRELYAFASPDGVRWTLMDSDPVMDETHSGLYNDHAALDSHNVAFYSETEQQYVMYARDWKDGIRRITRSTSSNMLDWSTCQLMEYRYFDGLAHPCEEHYISSTHPYVRAPHIYLAPAARLVLGEGGEFADKNEALSYGVDGDYYDNNHDDASYNIFMTTRGNLIYERLLPGEYIEPPDEVGPQAARSNYPGPEYVQTGPRELSLYVSHNYASTSNHLRRYALRLDGFGSIHASNVVGEATTKTLTFTGQRLLLNYKAEAGGSIKVELRNESGTPLTGFAEADAVALTGDEIDGVASWSGGADLASLTGTTVRARFVMQNADLYALRFADLIENEAASEVTATNALLNGVLNGAIPADTLFVAWGEANGDAGGAWDRVDGLSDTAAGSVFFAGTNLAADTTYFYTFFYSNGTEVVRAAPVEFFPTAFGPAAVPDGLSARTRTSTAVALTWSDNSATETGFRIELSTNETAWTVAGTVNAGTTSWTATDLDPATLYTFRVSAFNTRHASAPSASASARTETGWVNTAALSGLQTVRSLIALADGSLLAGGETDTPVAAKVFRSADGGTNWTELGAFPATSDRAWRLFEAADGTIYCGARYSSVGQIVSSTDGGLNWTLDTAFAGNRYVMDFVQTAGGKLYAGAGLYGGDVYTWESPNWAKTPDDIGSMSAPYSLLLHSDGTMYAGGVYIAGAGNDYFYAQVYATSNGGTNWSEVGNISNVCVNGGIVYDLIETSGGLFLAGARRNAGLPFDSGSDEWGDAVICKRDAGAPHGWVELAEFPDMVSCYALLEAADGSLFAGMQNKAPGPARVYRSIDGGVTWNDTGPLPGASYVWCLAQDAAGYIYVGTGPVNGDVFKSSATFLPQPDPFFTGSLLFVR